MRSRCCTIRPGAGFALLAVAACATGDTGNGVLPDGGDIAEAAPDAAPDDGADTGCLPGLTLCASGCTDTTSDPGNCGACGHTCGATEVCNEGRCSGTCGSGRLACADGCVDPRTDDANCGTCGNACNDGLNADGRCELGHCILVCRTGWQDRDSAPGCETACEGSSVLESCNGIDDDCDGATDEDFACAVGRSTACTTSCGTTGSGPCTLACEPPAPAACTPPPEACNGADDDCDTLTDDGFACSPGTSGSCSTSCGSTGTRTCGSACVWDACTAPAEVCNGRDDDCDTRIDETSECMPGSTQGCTTSCGSGGQRTCGATCTWGSCVAPAESCNGRDDDCDGVADNGFRTVVQTTTYATLSTHHLPCNGTTQLVGPDCNAAVHRFCWRAGCANSGFGPVEAAAGSATVACVIGEAAQDVGFPALQAIHPGCDGVVQRAGPDCSAAIKRWCASRGFASGFGPVENSYPDAWVVCVPTTTARVLAATYTELATYRPRCNGTTERWGVDCNSAIDQWCRACGHATGFGPVENTGDTAYVTCMDP